MEPFVLVLGALVVASAVIIARTIDPSYVITVGVLLAVFSGNWTMMGFPIGVDRIVILGGMGALAVRAFEDRDLVPRLRPVHVVLGVFVAYAVGSALWSGTLTDRTSAFALLDQLGIVPFALFAVAAVAYRTPEQRGFLLAALVGLGGYLGVTALLETAGIDALIFPRYINDPAVGIHFDRARGPFVEAAANGGALYVSLVAAAVAFAVWRRPAARAVAVAVGVLCAFGIVATLTRQVWLASALVSVVTVASIPALRAYLLPGAVAVAMVVGLTFSFAPGLYSRAEGRAGAERPVWDRLNSNGAAGRMIEERPLFGWGWGRFEEVGADFYRQAATYPVTSVSQLHNVVLSFSAELGLVGLALWVLCVCFALLPGVRRRGPPELEPWRVGTIAIVLSWLTISNFTPLTYAYANYVVWLVMGIAYANATRAPVRLAVPAAGPARALAPA